MKRISALSLIIFLYYSIALGADMNPLREPGERFTRILGIDLMKDKLAEVITKLGKAW